MAEKPFPEKLDDFVFKYPEDSMIESILRMSYVTMTPQEQIKILENLGPDWIVKIAAKVEKKLAEIDKQGAS